MVSQFNIFVFFVQSLAQAINSKMDGRTKKAIGVALLKFLQELKPEEKSNFLEVMKSDQLNNFRSNYCPSIRW